MRVSAVFLDCSSLLQHRQFVRQMADWRKKEIMNKRIGSVQTGKVGASKTRTALSQTGQAV